MYKENINVKLRTFLLGPEVVWPGTVIVVARIDYQLESEVGWPEGLSLLWLE
jgi:hypothetical protein